MSSILQLTSSAIGALSGGTIGALASETQFTKKLNKRQKLALILLGAMTGASAGSDLGSTRYIKRKPMKKIALSITEDNMVPLYEKFMDKYRAASDTNAVIRSHLIEDRLANASTRTKMRQQNYMAFNPGEIKPNDDIYYRDAATNAEKVVPIHVKSTKGRLKQIGRFVKGIKKNPMAFSQFAMQHPYKPAAALAISGASMGFSALKDAMKKKPSKLKMVSSIALGTLKEVSPIVAGVVIGKKLSEKTAAPKFNPSVLGESMDDVFDVYVMYKAQERMYKREQERQAKQNIGRV